MPARATVSQKFLGNVLNISLAILNITIVLKNMPDLLIRRKNKTKRVLGRTRTSNPRTKSDGTHHLSYSPKQSPYDFVAKCFCNFQQIIIVLQILFLSIQLLEIISDLKC